jgi:hypothetical protein
MQLGRTAAHMAPRLHVNVEPHSSMSLQQELSGILNFRPVRLAALAILFAGVGTACFVTKLSVLDLDVWWHLAAGDWIVQHHAVPHVGILSRTAADRSWMAYSWGYEVLLSRSYAWFGFVGVGLFGTALTIAVAAAVFWMIRRISGRFWTAWLLSIVVCFAFLFNIMPRPVFFSMLLFAIALTLLLKANRTGHVQWLYWLPVVFLIWANVHIQFIYGLLAFGLLAGINGLQRAASRLRLHPDLLREPSLPLGKTLIVLGCSIAATCIGPYTFHVYDAVFGYAGSKVIYSMITEMQALSFAGPSHFVELLLAAAAFFAVGWQKKIDPFKLALLVAASIFGFRMTRDAWFLCITAAGVIADSLRLPDEPDQSLRLPEFASVAVAVALLLVLVARNTEFDQRGLDRAISGQFPVDAVNFLRKHPVGGPLYNSFDWGGFLSFYMPDYPVAIDGRTDLYGDGLDAQFYAVEGADPSYATDPYLNESGLVILQNKVPLAKLLPSDRRFRVVYHDDLTTVLARN